MSVGVDLVLRRRTGMGLLSGVVVGRALVGALPLMVVGWAWWGWLGDRYGQL